LMPSRAAKPVLSTLITAVPPGMGLLLTGSEVDGAPCDPEPPGQTRRRGT
jgi:hypothetical protein